MCRQCVVGSDVDLGPVTSTGKPHECPLCTPQDRSANVAIAGHGFVQNLRRVRSELAVEEPAHRRLAVAFDELTSAI
jgi:hypothetical protein